MCHNLLYDAYNDHCSCGPTKEDFGNCSLTTEVPTGKILKQSPFGIRHQKAVLRGLKKFLKKRFFLLYNAYISDTLSEAF